MKKRIGLIAMLAAAGLANAATQEWNFFSDPVGTSLTNAYNSAGDSTFEPKSGSDDSALQTDGFGSLVSTNDDTSSTSGMWTNGAILSADIGASVTSGVHYLRYDFTYDLSDTSSLNDSGCVVGFAFTDNTSNTVAGIALQYDVGASNTAPYTVTEITELTNTVGQVAVVAELNLDNKTLAVWYSLTGSTAGFNSASPMITVSNLNLTTYNSLGFQATGDIQPAGSTDQVAVQLLRTADDWAGIMAAAPVAPAANYANEWTFERDVTGRALSQTINSGTNSPLAQFEAGFGTTVYTTNMLGIGNVLLCTGEDPGTDGVWTNGAILNATLPPASTGVHYLRYDVEYDLSSPSNNSGTVLGVYFTGGTGDKAAGLVLGYDKGDLTNTVPAGRTLTAITNGLALTGSLTAIAEVNLDDSTLKVWYSLDGSNPAYASHSFTTNIALTSITNLRFHATGDFRPAGSDDYAAVDNIRHTMDSAPDSTAWSEIIEPLADLTAPPALSLLVSDTLGGSMELGETNIVNVVISNGAGAGAATDTTSSLTHDGPLSAFTIVSNNAPVTLLAGESVTNTYELVANERGNYTLSVTALSAQTNTAPETFPLSAGANLSFLPEGIAEVSGGSYAGLYEPGETLNITITTTNDGARAVSNVVNTLTAATAGFTITPASATYPALPAGGSTSTVYQVVIGASVALGDYTFYMTNTAGSLSWNGQFVLKVSTRQPGSDWVKADNTNHLNQTDSWVNGLVPDATDRAVMDQTVTAPITTALGADLAWRGIALASNTAAWTISGTNTLTTGSWGIDMDQAGANLTIASKLALATTQTWNVATSRTLTVSGPISGTNSAPLVKSGGGTLVITNTANTFRGGLTVSNGTLSVANNNALGRGSLTLSRSTLATTANTLLTNSIVLTDSAVITNANDLTLNGIISGPGSLTKTGAGTLILNGANTWSGGTTNAGLIEVDHASALGTGPVVMQPNSALQAAPAIFTLNNPGIQNEILINGPATIKTAASTADDMVRIDGDISGAGPLTVEGYQILLYGNNTFSGGLNLRHSDWLRLSSPASLGSGPIDVSGGARLILFNGNGSVSNHVTLASTLRINLNTRFIELSGPLTGAGILNLQDSSGTLTLSGDNSGWTGNINNLRGAKTINVNHPSALGTGTINYGGAVGRVVMAFNTGIASLNNPMRINSTFNSSTGQSLPLEFNVNQDVLFAGNLQDGASINLAGVEKTGDAKLTLAGAATYSGPTKVLAGTLDVIGSITGDLLVQGSGTLSGSGNVGNVSLDAGSALKMAASQTLNFNGSLDALSGSQIILPVLSTGSFARLQGSSGYEAWLGGSLVLDFTGSTVQAGDVFQILSGWDFISDQGVTIDKIGLEGTLELDTSNLFVDGTVSLVAVTVTPVPLLPGDIRKANNADDLNLTTSWETGVVPGTTNRAVYDATILLPRTTLLGADATWQGIALISNSVQWTISGNHKLTLRTGGIDLSDARADLNITSKLELGTGQSWKVGPLRTLTVSGVISGTNSAGLLKTGEGVLVVNGSVPNTYAGNTTINQGALAVSGTNALGSGKLTIDGASLTTAGGSKLGNETVLTNSAVINNNHLLTLDGIISGPGSLTKTGAGGLHLKGANTYSGGTTNSGWIALYGPQSLGSGKVVMNDGSTLYADSSAFIASTFLANNIELYGNTSFETITDSAGVMNLSGNITGSGSLTVTGYNYRLFGNNSFSGGLNLNNNNWLFFKEGGLGSGTITSLLNDAFLRATETATITNHIVMNNNLRFRVDSGTLTLAGPMSGTGILKFQDGTPTVVDIPNANPGRTGTTWLRASTLRIGHENALGSGQIQLFASSAEFGFAVSTHLTGARRVQNNLRITGVTYDGTTGLIYPIKLNLDHDLELSGTFASGFTDEKGLLIEKNGPGSLILSGENSYAHHMNVNAGSLVINHPIFNSERVTIAGGATLSGTGSVNKVIMKSDSKLDLSGGGMQFNGDLSMEGPVVTLLSVSTANSALHGNGVNTLSVGGTLKLDFSGNSTVAVNDTFTVFRNWGTLIDNGLTVLPVGLPLFTRLDTSNLFVDGTITVIPSRISETGKDIEIVDGTPGITVVDLVVTNTTGSPLTFDLSDNAVWDVFYTVRTNANPETFLMTGGTVMTLLDPDGAGSLTALNDGYSAAVPIGFPFKLYGQTFSNFFVSAEGAIGLGDSGEYIGTKSIAPLPHGTQPIIAPFWSNLSVTNNSIRYNRSTSKLVISYQNTSQVGGGTNLSFQSTLYPDGRVLLQYKTISGTRAANAACGLQSGTLATNTGLVPESGKAVLLTPVEDKWITWQPSGTVTVPANGSVVIRVSIDTSGRPAGTVQSFSQFFNWGSGGTTEVPFYVEVASQQPSIAVSTNLISFSGLAGTVATNSSLVVSNNGNVAVNFTIEDSAADQINYSGQLVDTMTGWNTLTTGLITDWIKPEGNRFVTAEDEGHSPLINIGFDFPFYGAVYNTLSVGVNGGISLGAVTRISAAGDLSTVRPDVPDRFIAPYWGDLVLASNSTVRTRRDGDRFIVSWNNMRQYGSPAGTNLNFQAVLHKSGEIEFLYKDINGSRWSATPAGLRNYSERVPSETVETVYTPEYTNTVWNPTTGRWEDEIIPESTSTRTVLFYGVQNTSTNLYIRGTDDVVTTNQVAGTDLVRTNIVNQMGNRSIRYIPGREPIITYSPSAGTLAVGAVTAIELVGNASLLTPGGTNSVVNNTRLFIEYSSDKNSPVDVKFTVTNSVETAMASPLALMLDSDGDGIPDDEERLAGTDPYDPNSMFVVSTDTGTRTLSWGYAEGRYYTVWYTTSLTAPFIPHPDATRIQTNGFTDDLNKDQPSVFYKVTVE